MLQVRYRHSVLVALVLLMCVCISGVAVSAVPTPNVAPVNPEFTSYLSSLSRGTLQSAVTADGHPLGVVPPPIDLSFNAGKQMFTSRRYLSLPTLYDLRTTGKLTDVRDQGAAGSCWAFGAIASLESGLMPGESWDFSENNLKNLQGFDRTHSGGGNSLMSTAYLARWDGPVLEQDDPYNDYSGYSPLGLPARKHVQNVLFIPDKAGSLDNDNIKQAVMNYGAVATCMYWDDDYYNSTWNSYYRPFDTGTNHIVAIVGWDDNYPASRFNSMPPGNGAFIIKNSWGPDWGDSGYFYASYYDATVGSYNYVFQAEPTANYDDKYDYDPLGLTTSLGLGSSTGWYANVFAARSVSQLVAVSTYSVVPGSTYRIDVYKGVTDSPVSGTSLSTTTGACTYGYFTIPLSTPVSLNPGDRYSVVIKVVTPGYSWPIPVEMQISGYSSRALANNGESYASLDGSYWYDPNTDFGPDYWGTNVCIKAFVKNAPTVAAPTFSPGAGKYSSSQMVRIATSTAGATIRYTTDGTEPTETSKTYTAALRMDRTMTIKARAWAPGMSPSAVSTAAYTMRAAGIVYVNPTSTGTVHNGTSWATGYLKLPDALSAAVYGDQIWVKKGTYAGSFTLNDGCRLYGGFAGTETSLSQRNWVTNPTILDGGGKSRVLLIAATPACDTVVDGFTIQNGSSKWGGGIYAVGNAKIQHNTIKNNLAYLGTGGYGGGIYVNSGASVISDNIIVKNTAKASGDTGSSSVVSMGGGICCNDRSTPRIINNTIADNACYRVDTLGQTAAGMGGGVACLQGTKVFIANNIVSGNDTSAGLGDGIYNLGGTLTLTRNCVYQTNSAYYGVSAGTTDVAKSPLFVNSATGNYHLQLTSPCAEAGDDTLVASDMDIDMTARTFGTHVDIGADESSVAPPANVLVMPIEGTLATAVPLTFTCVYFDPNGATNLSKVYFMVNKTLTAKSGVYLLYDVVNNKLWIENDGGTALIGGQTPGTNAIIENSQCKVYTQFTTINKSGPYMAVNWCVEMKSAIAGWNCNAYMRAENKLRLIDGWESVGKFLIQ